MIRSLASNIPILAVSPWMSARSRELLAKDGINFIDLTGNALLKLENPALYISAVGAARNPQPVPRGQARVRGPKAARLIRLLIDVSPPYGVTEVAAVTGLTQGYVSRLLDALDQDALIERTRRGRVEDVDMPGLLRRWAESYDVLKSNDASTFLAPRGANDALSQLAELSGPAVAITGSFAAVRLAPVAAPALLIAYCNEIEALANTLGLLPADEGANVVLLRAFDPVVWERGTEDAGLRYVAPSQAAVDCLTGTGRMPAEGEALIAWMAENEPRWRLSSITISAPLRRTHDRPEQCLTTPGPRRAIRSRAAGLTRHARPCSHLTATPSSWPAPRPSTSTRTPPIRAGPLMLVATAQVLTVVVHTARVAPWRQRS